MEHAVREQQGVSIVSLSGEVDLETSPEARRVLLDCVGQGKPLLVDLSAVTYIDSSGVASLVETYQAARADGGSFALVMISDAVRRVLQLARLDKIFSIYDTIEDGIGDGA